MNKAELIEIIAEQANVTKVEANAVINSLLKTVSACLEDGEKVTLVGFGVFSVLKRTSRNCFYQRIYYCICLDFCHVRLLCNYFNQFCFIHKSKFIVSLFK